MISKPRIPLSSIIIKRYPSCLICCLLALTLVFILNDVSYYTTSISEGRYKSNIFCYADEDEDFLAEILAEQAREEEELAKIEAEAREYDAMKARQQQQQQNNGMPGSNGNAGRPKMGKMGGAGGANTNYSKLEEELKKKESEQQQNANKQQQQSNTQSAEDEMNETEAERIRLKREQAFEAELKKMNDEQRKKAQKQKKKDAKVVKRILKAHKANKHYQVLGIHNFEFQIGPLFIFNFSIGPIVLFRVKTKQIKKVYRNLARTVHPDKNRDGRAVEAFHALESSAAVLTDDKQRSDYDKRIISARRRRNRYAFEKIMSVSEFAWNKTVRTFGVTKKVLGPFSTPIMVIGALII